jgi:predicted PurR-regulated permease PerM
MGSEANEPPGQAESGESPANVLILPTSVERELDQSDESLGALGRPFDHRSPFFMGLTGALGVGVAYVLFRGVADISSVLVIIGLALFIAVGLDPILVFLVNRGLARGVAVGLVTLGFLLVIAVFVLAAVSPLSHEIQILVKNYPKYKANIAAGKGWAGKLLLSLGVATISVVALTIYFLIALPGVKKLWLSLIARSGRVRAELLTDEVFGRVGGFMLGIAGVIVSLVALTKEIPVAFAAVGFYVVYRYLEDYLLNPWVMKHTVKVTPGLTIIATLIGGTLLGLIGALMAIPVAATIHLVLEEVAVPRQNQR